MIRIIEPASFASALEGILAELEPRLKEVWFDCTALTALWKQQGGIYDRLGKALELQCWKEYWSVDAVFYEKADERTTGGIYAEALSIAMEHENGYSTAQREMNKLSIIDAPLKVLVTYPETDKQEKKLLDRLTEILVHADTFGDFASKRRHLVVLGRMVEQRLEWQFWLFDGAGFVGLHMTNKSGNA